MTQKQIAASGKTSLSLDDLVNIEKHYRSQFTGGNTIAVHMLMPIIRTLLFLRLRTGTLHSVCLEKIFTTVQAGQDR